LWPVIAQVRGHQKLGAKFKTVGFRLAPSVKQIEQNGGKKPFLSQDYPDQNATRKGIKMAQKRPDSLMTWINYYLEVGVKVAKL